MPNFTGTEGDDSVAGSIGDDSFTMLGGNDTVFASSGNDHISGGEGNDHLEGNEGNDIINGDGGDDFLVGGLGADIVDGGAGNDLFSVRDDYPSGSQLTAGDQFIGGDGFDRIIFSGTYSGQWFDITTLSISGIEAITAEWTVKLTFAQFSSLTQA